MELEALLNSAASQLAEAGVPTPRVDAELLAGHVLGLSRGEVQAKAVAGATMEELAAQLDTGRCGSPKSMGALPEALGEAEHGLAERLMRLVQERAQRVPLQHLTGLAPFRTLELRVGPGVFIPRPETESVVELVLEQLRKLADQGIDSPRLVDLGTGSGAIAASIAAEYPAAEVHAVEVSEQAAAWARLNFDQLPPGSAPVTVHHCDLRDFPELIAPSAGISSSRGRGRRRDPHTRWERLAHATSAGAETQTSQGPDSGPRFDVVVSNPPYIPPAMVPNDREVHEHDPEIALYGGGADGLELPRAVIATATQILRPGGWLVLEHAEVQAGALREFCAGNPELTDVATHQDLNGRDRATSARLVEPAHHADMTGGGRRA